MPTNLQTVILGNSTDININPSISNHEIRADIQVDEYTPIKLWGQILDGHNQPVPDVFIKLVKIISSDDIPKYQNIAYTVSDIDGFYQFDICSNENAWYKILVGRSNTGKEIIIDDANSSCPNHI